MSRQLVRLPYRVLARIADLPPSVSGRVMAWGLRCYDGEAIFIDEEEKIDPELRNSLMLAAELLDSTALALNIIDVPAFTIAGLRDRKIAKKRIEQKEAREQQQESERAKIKMDNVIPLRKYATSGMARSEPNPADYEKPLGLAAMRSLMELGLNQANSREIVTRFGNLYGLDAVLDIIEKMKGRKVGNIEKYLERSLRNWQSPAGSGNSAEISSFRAPRAIRRMVMQRKGGAWEFLGWTCRDHPMAGKGVPGRKKVWRTDSGKLSYKFPDDNEVVPDFDTDPGVIEVD